MSEQLSFLPEPLFCPLLPKRGSKEEQALHDLMERDLTTPDWIAEGKGWRLSAKVKELDYLGWEPVSVMVLCSGWAEPIARYSLSEKAKQAFNAMRQQGGANV